MCDRELLTRIWGEPQRNLEAEGCIVVPCQFEVPPLAQTMQFSPRKTRNMPKQTREKTRLAGTISQSPESELDCEQGMMPGRRVFAWFDYFAVPLTASLRLQAVATIDHGLPAQRGTKPGQR